MTDLTPPPPRVNYLDFEAIERRRAVALDVPVPGPYDVPRTPDGRFAPGNPGRRRGSRNRMANELAMAFLDDFWRHEASVVQRARRWHLPHYLALLGRFLPRETPLTGPDFSDYSPAERAGVLAAAREALAAIERGEGGLDDLMAALQHDPARVAPETQPAPEGESGSRYIGSP